MNLWSHWDVSLDEQKNVGALRAVSVTKDPCAQVNFRQDSSMIYYGLINHVKESQGIVFMRHFCSQS